MPKHVTLIAAAGVTALAVAGCNSGSSGSSENSDTSANAPGMSAPPSFPPVAQNATMTLDTNDGQIGIAMDPAAPTTDASMAYLANKGYFNGTSCHRLVTEGIYVLQCGDPEGTGGGGPGYQIPDENLPADGTNNYPRGTVAMANSGPNTNGSQFFIVYQDTTLPADYTKWGEVTQGLDVVERVAAAGVQGGGSDGEPAQTLTITSASVE